MKAIPLIIMAGLLMSAFGLCGKKTNDLSGPLRIGFDSEPRTFDPRYALDANSQYLENLINCSLIGFDPDGKVVGDLATDWRWQSDRSLRFILNKQFKFSNGQPVTAADVKETYAFFGNKELKDPSPRSGAFRNISAIKPSKSGDSIIFELKEPDASFLTNFVVGILPRELASQEKINEPSKHVGCGPFKLAEKGLTTWKLKKNDNYGGEHAPLKDDLEIKIVKSESTRFAKLRKGEINIVQNTLNREVLDDIGKKYSNLKIITRPGLRTTYVGFNMKDKIAGNIAVRQAISKSIDRDKIIKYIFNGMATPAKTILTPGNPYLLESLEVPVVDLDAAKKLLDNAGFKDPDGDGPKERFTLSYKTTTNATRINIAKAIAAQLGKIGIKVVVQPLEWGKFKQDVENGRVQIWSLTWIGFKDPDIYRYAFGSENVPPNGPNRGWYKNARLDKLLNDAVRTTNDELRKNLYHQAQEIVAEELPYVFLWHEQSFAVVSKEINGFELYADGRLTSLSKVVVKQ